MKAECAIKSSSRRNVIWSPNTAANRVYTITAEILARSLANSIGQTHELVIYPRLQRARADHLTICYRKKQIDVSFSCACPVIENEFCHNIANVIANLGSTATLTML